MSKHNSDKVKKMNRKKNDRILTPDHSRPIHLGQSCALHGSIAMGFVVLRQASSGSFGIVSVIPFHSGVSVCVCVGYAEYCKRCWLVCHWMSQRQYINNHDILHTDTKQSKISQRQDNTIISISAEYTHRKNNRDEKKKKWESKKNLFSLFFYS